MSDFALSAAQILSALPHRFPLLLIDRVLTVGEEGIVAIKNVSWGEPYFQGHFPGAPVMPGVLQVEAMAQAGGILAHKLGYFDAATQVVLFMGLDKVRFRRPVTPGDQLVLSVKPLRKGKVWKMAGEARVGDQLASEAEFLATVVDRSAMPA